MTDRISSIRTPWTAILAAQHGDAETRTRCLSELAEKYYGPVRSYIGALPGANHPETADDLTQGFFHKFLQKEIVDKLDRETGMFRQFLKTAIRNYVKDEIARGKRDNPNSPFTKHAPLPAGEISISGKQSRSPEEEFNRCWARELVADAVVAFKADCFDHNKQHYYAVFERHVLAPDDFGDPDYAATAAALNISEKDVANYLHRSRKRFQALLLAMVGTTVRDKKDAEQELAALRRYF